GKSLGARIASMCVAEGMPAAGLVFLGYPLHPPGKPTQLRTEHLARVEVPMLWLEGTRDPFATREPLSATLRSLGARAELVEIPGGDHSFRTRKSDPPWPRDDREIGARLAEHAASFMDGHAVASLPRAD